VDDREGAENELKGLIELVNRTWERRDEITPDTTTRQRPTPMAIYKLLPNTNCKQCCEPTCYSFALKLAVSQKKLPTARRSPNRNTLKNWPHWRRSSSKRPRLGEETNMEKALTVVLEDRDIIELMRILMDPRLAGLVGAVTPDQLQTMRRADLFGLCCRAFAAKTIFG
jgi:hypothetical protein